MFREFAYISGDMETLGRDLMELRLRNDEVWVEIVYEGQRIPDLRERVMELVAGSKVEILKIKNTIAEVRTQGLDSPADIGELDEADVFMRCMEKRSVPENERPELIDTYRRVLASIYEETTAS
jgi:exonuclease SbcD